MISSARRAALLLVATFVLGAATGAAAMAYAAHAPAPPPSKSRSAWYLDHLTSNLDLSPVQRDSVKAVLDHLTPAMDSLMAEVRPRMDSLRAMTRAEITRFLDPRQQKEYEAMRQKHEQERKAGGSNGR